MELLHKNLLLVQIENLKRGIDHFLEQTVLKVGSKQDQFPTQTGEVATPLTQFTQNIMGTSVITVTPKAKTTQTKNVYTANAHSARFLST